MKEIGSLLGYTSATCQQCHQSVFHTVFNSHAMKIFSDIQVIKEGKRQTNDWKSFTCQNNILHVLDLHSYFLTLHWMKWMPNSVCLQGTTLALKYIYSIQIWKASSSIYHAGSPTECMPASPYLLVLCSFLPCGLLCATSWKQFSESDSGACLEQRNI